MKPDEWMKSPMRAQISHNRKVASEMENRPIRFPTEADVGAQRNRLYRCEFGEYEGVQVDNIPHKYIEKVRRSGETGNKLGPKAKQLLREYAHT